MGGASALLRDAQGVIQHPHSIQPDVKSSPNSPPAHGCDLGHVPGSAPVPGSVPGPGSAPVPRAKGSLQSQQLSEGTGHSAVINHSDQQKHHNKARHPTEINETSLINLVFFFFFSLRGKYLKTEGERQMHFVPAWMLLERLRCRRRIKAEVRMNVGMENKLGGWRSAGGIRGTDSEDK